MSNSEDDDDSLSKRQKFIHESNLINHDIMMNFQFGAARSLSGQNNQIDFLVDSLSVPNNDIMRLGLPASISNLQSRFQFPNFMNNSTISPDTRPILAAALPLDESYLQFAASQIQARKLNASHIDGDELLGNSMNYPGIEDFSHMHLLQPLSCLPVYVSKLNGKNRANRRCRICGIHCSFYCEKCSDWESGKIIPICNPFTTARKPCYFKHMDESNSNILAERRGSSSSIMPVTIRSSSSSSSKRPRIIKKEEEVYDEEDGDGDEDEEVEEEE